MKKILILGFIFSIHVHGFTNASIRATQPQEDCLNILGRYLRANPQEPWSNNSSVRRIIDDKCEVLVSWHSDLGNQPCVFFYVVDLSRKQVKWKEDQGCWNPY